MKLYDKIMTFINGKLSQLNGLLLFVIIILLMVNIISRLLGSSVSGLTTLTVLVLIAIVYLGLSVTEQKDEHASVDILANLLSNKWLNSNKIFIYILNLLTISLFLYKSIESVIHSYKINEVYADVVNIPMWPAKLAISVGLFFFGLQILYKLIGSFIIIFKKET